MSYYCKFYMVCGLLSLKKILKQLSQKTVESQSAINLFSIKSFAVKALWKIKSLA